MSWKGVGDNFPGKAQILRLLRLSPSYFGFLGGIFISLSINLYTDAFAADVLPIRWRTILVAASCIFISGLFWTVIAWNLEPIHHLVIAQPTEGTDEQKEREVWDRFLGPKLTRLVIYLIVACSAALTGLGVLLIP